MTTDKNQKKTIHLCETLADISLTGQDFSGKRLVGSIIQSARFLDGHVRYLCAQKSKLQDVLFDHVICDDGSYLDCRWEKVHVKNSLFTANHFSGCTIEKTEGTLSSFGLSTFDKCNLRGSNLSEIAFSGSWWNACRFEREDYFFVRFPSSVFIDTHFVECRLQKVIFRAATFIRCTFEKCTLNESVFHKARLIDTKWIDTDIKQAANLDEVRYD